VQEPPSDVRAELKEKQDSMDTEEIASLWEMLRKIAPGDLRPEVEEILEMLKEDYGPKIDALKHLADVLNDDMPAISEILWGAVEPAKAISCGIVQALERILGEQRKLHNDYAEHGEVKTQITQANKFMADFNEMFKLVEKLADALLSSREINDTA
jgi:hypothetical protein